MTQNRLTTLELYYHGSYIGKWGNHAELFRYGSKFYAVQNGVNVVVEVPDDVLKTILVK